MKNILSTIFNLIVSLGCMIPIMIAGMFYGMYLGLKIWVYNVKNHFYEHWVIDIEKDRLKLSKKILLEWFQLFDNFEDICDLNVVEDCCPDCNCCDCPFFSYENWTEFKELIK